MKKIMIRKPEFEALNKLLKIARKDRYREVLHNLLVEDGAVHATNGKMLIRLNKGVNSSPEPLESGVYEILKIDKLPRMPTIEVTINKIDGQPPAMSMIINAPVNKDFKSFTLHLDNTTQGITHAVIRIFKVFGHAFNYEFLNCLSSLDCNLYASLLNGTSPAVKLESDAVTALIMPFTIDK